MSNFFESILEPKIYRVFRELGYNRLLSLELARLCTRIRHFGNPSMPKEKKLLKKFPYRKSRFIGHVPQGAATSPLLANIVSRGLDASIREFSRTMNITYTRYADDLIFSSKSKFDRQGAHSLVKDLYELIKAHGYWPNLTKTKVSPPGARKIVLGLLVDGRTPRLTKEFKSEIKTHIHFITRPDVGIAKHMLNRGFDSTAGLRNFLYGKLSFAAHVEPLWAAKMRSKLDQVNWPKR
ncbi:RNA-directed DNA polymerase [Pseudomonas sp. ATCC PTA-122608]|nr:RNA-directed DNA polymerase [Pseudomonas sp. ATCC PTA-122608]